MPRGHEVSIPRRLATFCSEDPERTRWLAALPLLIDDCSRRWGLTLGAPFDDCTLPATRRCVSSRRSRRPTPCCSSGASRGPRSGLAALEELARPSGDDVLLATDLHAGNVLRARRRPWLVIDPKPFVGDAAYDATQHLLNILDRVHADPAGATRSFAERLGLDARRVRQWLFARLAAEPRASWRTGAARLAMSLRS